MNNSCILEFDSVTFYKSYCQGELSEIVFKMQLKIVEREWNEFRNSAASPDMVRRTPTFKRKAKFRSEFEALLSDVESELNSDSEDEMPVN